MKDAFYAYMHERYRIFLRKEAGEPPPWTDDWILRKYKFTNVKRAHDRTTRHFRAIYDQHRDAPYEDIVLNCAVYRYFGTAEMADALGWLTVDSWDADAVEQVARERAADGLRVFTGAYMVTNAQIKAPKVHVVPHYFLDPIGRIGASNVADTARETRSWQSAFNTLVGHKGFGGTGFITKEVLQDAILTPVLEDATDIDTWTPFGPGARRGLERIYGKLRTDERLPATQDLHGLQYDPDMWPAGFPHLNLHDIQFSLCEFDKHQRVLNGEGVPKTLYKSRVPAYT